MGYLFSQKGNFCVVKLSEADAHGDTDHLRRLRELVLENEPMYPNIKKWFDEKVITGLKASERIGYVGYLDEKPTVSAIVKRGEDAKFCHLRIKDELQDINLGEAFFALMGLEVREFSKEVHFTVPEGLWAKKKGFFKSFGFEKAVKAGHQYRLFENELWCSSGFNKVWTSILKKLPKIARAFVVNGQSLESGLVMSIRPKYARKILSGRKKVEVRRMFSKKWKGSKISIYASGRERSLVGEALIKDVIFNRPENIWERFSGQIGCTKEDFDKYTESRNNVYAVVLEDAMPYRKSISIREVSSLTRKNLRPPQNYYNLDNNAKWAEAVSLGALLQDSFRAREPVLL